MCVCVCASEQGKRERKGKIERKQPKKREKGREIESQERQRRREIEPEREGERASLHMSLHPNATNVLGVGLSINPLHPLLASSRHDQRFFLPVVILRASAIAQYSLSCVVFIFDNLCKNFCSRGAENL